MTASLLPPSSWATCEYCRRQALLVNLKNRLTWPLHPLNRQSPPFRHPSYSHLVNSLTRIYRGLEPTVLCQAFYGFSIIASNVLRILFLGWLKSFLSILCCLSFYQEYSHFLDLNSNFLVQVSLLLPKPRLLIFAVENYHSESECFD